MLRHLTQRLLCLAVGAGLSGVQPASKALEFLRTLWYTRRNKVGDVQGALR